MSKIRNIPIFNGAKAGAISGAVAGSFYTWGFDRVMAQSVAGGLGSEIMGGEFKDGFKVAFVTASARYLYAEISSPKYNSTGKPHLWEEGRSDVGKQLTPRELEMIAKGEMENLHHQINHLLCKV
jgi:hypothetical protein